MRLSLSCFNPKRTDKKVTDDVIAQHLAGRDAGEFKKNLVDKSAIEPITKHDTQFRQWHYDHTLPWKDEGWRLLPTIGLMEYNDGTRQFVMKRKDLIATFVDSWPSLIERAKERLNGMFNPGEYPGQDELLSKFDVSIEFSPVPTGGDFRIDVAQEIVDEMAKSTDSAVAEAQKAAVKDVWDRLATPLLHMANKLKDDNGRFKDSLVTNVLEVAELAPKLNLTGDSRLDSLASEIRAAFMETKPDDLRDNKEIRSATAQKADDLLARLAGYM